MNSEKKSKKVAYTGLLAAIAASSCCIPPVIALLAGVGGGASALSWMEPFRPYLIGLAIIAIGYAWYNYLKPKNAENDDCGCEIGEKPKWFQTRGFLITITLFAILSISFPHYASIFYPDNKKEVVVKNTSNIQTINFDIKGMTCSACEEHVSYSINKLDGIIDVNTSYLNKNSEVKFDASKTSKEAIVKAIDATGYKVIN